MILRHLWHSYDNIHEILKPFYIQFERVILYLTTYSGWVIETNYPGELGSFTWRVTTWISGYCSQLLG